MLGSCVFIGDVLFVVRSVLRGLIAERRQGGLGVKYGLDGERKCPELGQTGRRRMYGLCAQELVIDERLDRPIPSSSNAHLKRPASITIANYFDILSDMKGELWMAR